MTDSTEAPDRAAARGRIARRRALARTAMTFVVVWIALIAIWALTSPGEYFWPVWPIAGMALGLGFQALGLKGPRPITDDEIDREVSRR